jgi:hypothetical protein
MKVKEMIELLQTLPQDHIIVMSKDAEGNGFSPLSDCGLSMYIPDSTYSGEVLSEEDLDYRNEDADEDEIQEYNENAVVLWPVN